MAVQHRVAAKVATAARPIGDFQTASTDRIESRLSRD
jgi:hypothetical protein